MSLPDTDHYVLVVTTDPEHPDTPCYGVMNKETGVIEYYDNLMPRTYQAMVHTEERYKEMEDMMAGNKPVQLELIQPEGGKQH
jgi:hypothetical protein